MLKVKIGLQDDLNHEPFVVYCTCSGGAGQVQLSTGGTDSGQHLQVTLDHSG